MRHALLHCGKDVVIQHHALVIDTGGPAGLILKKLRLQESGLLRLPLIIR